MYLSGNLVVISILRLFVGFWFAGRSGALLGWVFLCKERKKRHKQKRLFPSVVKETASIKWL
jgi:hypothetical protein